MAHAQETLAAPLKKAGAATKEAEWIEVGEDFGFTPSERVRVGSNEHAYITQVFDTEKKYMFELAESGPQLENPSYMVTDGGRRTVQLKQAKFTPLRNIILSAQIVWNGQRRNVRYYDGCTSIFVDKQPADRELLKTLLEQTGKQRFHEGKKGFMGYERMILLYLNICSWNVESPFRTKTANGIFRPINADKVADETTSRIEMMEEALRYAKEATDTKMLIHANYLGIHDTDWDSGNDLSPKEIRAKYREWASNNPAEFIQSYGNKAIELKYYIEKGLESGIINTKFNPNKATWKASNTVVCDISGLRAPDAIAQKIFEFSQTEEGQDFVLQLRALSDK